MAGKDEKAPETKAVEYKFIGTASADQEFRCGKTGIQKKVKDLSQEDLKKMFDAGSKAVSKS